jgi:hypothetical protein
VVETGLHALVERGTSADQQRRLHHRRRSLDDVIRWLIDATEQA